MRQDDPAKCTSAKMRRLGFAKYIRSERIPKEAIVLNPSASLPVLKVDREFALKAGIVVIDCSWNLANSVFTKHFRGVQRKLPALLAGNPTNYSKLGMLSSVEAVAAALYIMDFKEHARRVLSIYKWGETFLTLNLDPLEDYAKATTLEELQSVESSYFSHLV